ncbi:MULTISPECIES: cytochrome c-550 PedF [Arcobacteraceae]|uniref:Cytochrome c-550 PedF n=1 Tax=Poseidonibacter parvus TaxID=1850254 RepID=A0A1P8KJT1_9BACT|nr:MULTISPECIES: cytochrome c-550 PedF [Arcobacteraceae]APW64823.1 cytochrome c-550 PedF [Poseidonibacter parvus]
MKSLKKVVLVALATSTLAFGHGDVVPHSVETKGLANVADDVIVNPFRGNEKAIEIGKGAYNTNCARCHGLGAVSGGVAPDLRALDAGDDDIDEYFVTKVIEGAVRNGNVYMPPFGEVLSPAAIWSIRSWVETLPTDDL